MTKSASGALSVSQKMMLVEQLLQKAKALGAEAADAMVYDSTSLSSSVRLGKLEDSDRSEARDLGLRVFVGQRQASVSSNDFSEETLSTLAERAVAMARLAPEDPYCGLADPSLFASSSADLDLEDTAAPTTQALTETSLMAETAGLEVSGVTNSLGAGAGWGRVEVVFATSNGFAGSYASTSYSTSCSVLAGEGAHMERDYDGHSARHYGDLRTANEIGQTAGQRAVAKLSPQKVKSQSVPVIYDPRVAMTLVGHFSGAINGASISRGTSFLKDFLGDRVFQQGITISDDPHRVRGLGSKLFDGEGVQNSKKNLIEDGVLSTWLLNSASAKQLGLKTSGHASRGTGGPPGISTTNLYLGAGSSSPKDLLGDIQSGFYVTSLIGQGVNMITGDYSRGASGFWIENGEITFPVSEVTIAGNLKEMFLNLAPANDLEFKYATNAPTLRVEGMTIAGA